MQNICCCFTLQWYHASTYYTMISLVAGFATSVFASLVETSLTVGGAGVEAGGGVEATGGVVPVVAISLISSLILRVTASCTAPGGLSAISSTSLKVRTSLRREARDCRSSVVGPSNRRNSCALLARQGEWNDVVFAHSIAPHGPTHPCLKCVVCGGQCSPCGTLAYFLDEVHPLHQCSKA
jgi:hypothetical protein